MGKQKALGENDPPRGNHVANLSPAELGSVGRKPSRRAGGGNGTAYEAVQEFIYSP